MNLRQKEEERYLNKQSSSSYSLKDLHQTTITSLNKGFQSCRNSSCRDSLQLPHYNSQFKPYYIDSPVVTMINKKSCPPVISHDNRQYINYVRNNFKSMKKLSCKQKKPVDKKSTMNPN